MKRLFGLLLLGVSSALITVGLKAMFGQAGDPLAGHSASAHQERTQSPHSQSSVSPSAGASNRPLQRGDSLPDTHLIDQDGQSFRLSELAGRNLVVSFLYTHCNMPSMCPALAAKLVRTQELARQQKYEGLQILLISFDPERDSPVRLKEFADAYGADLSSIRFATGSAEEVRKLALALNVYFQSSVPGVIEHNITVSLVDRHGILRDDFFGNDWTPEDLIGAVGRL